MKRIFANVSAKYQEELLTAKDAKTTGSGMKTVVKTFTQFPKMKIQSKDVW